MPFSENYLAMIADELPYEVENIRFDVEPGGDTTIWFDLTGSRFAEPEAMTNILVDFDDFLHDLSEQEPALYASALGTAKGKAGLRHDRMLERLNAKEVDWPIILQGYISRRMDLEKTESERLGWLLQRRSRTQDTAWQNLTTAGQNQDPSWDEVANRLIDDMNTAVIALYPELNDATPDFNQQLRETLEFHMHRLANEVVALVKKSRN